VQGEWEKTPSRRAVHDAARALLGLSLGSCDELGLADDVDARALAAVVLDRLHGSETDRELAVLADHFGYPADAETWAKKLPEDDGVRAFVTGDDAKLSRAPGTLARFLEVVRLSRKGELEAASALSTRSLGRWALGPAVLSVRMCGGDDKVAPASLARALLDASLDAGVTVAGKAKADLDALRAADPHRVTGIVYGWLGIQRVEGFPRFEAEVDRAGAHDRGPFFDRATRQLLLRARAANAVRRIGLRLAAEKTPDAAEKAFADEVPASSTSELGRAFRAWHHALADARRAVPGLALPTGALGPVATVDVSETALSGLGAEVAEDEWDARASSRWALAHLDGRRSHRGLAVMLARGMLFDGALVTAARRDAEAMSSANGPRPLTVGIARKIPHGIDETAARAFAEHAPKVEGAAAIAAALANDDPKGAATAIAEMGAARPRAIAALVGASLADVVRDFAKASALHRAMTEAGVSLEVRRAIALGALAHDGTVLAAAILPALASEAKTPLLQLDLIEDAARAMGEDAAKSFRAEHPLGPAAPFAAPILFAHHRPIDPMGTREAGDLALLLSIANKETLRDPARLAAARTRLSGAPATRFAAFARHLVGLEDLQTVLNRPTNADERCELAFYLAIAAESAGRAEDAVVWLQTALDEGNGQLAEWRWAVSRSR
ncbi:MAG: hypothetical protein ACXVEE_34710, partial [Polyangiales bacterium]